MRLRSALITPALSLALLLGSASSWAFVTVGVSITLPPPPLPVYEQPAVPGPGYIWTPGYWAWSEDSGYYWVPGTWILPPRAGLLWTPGYWGWADGLYVWNRGYWAPQVGFYGGIDYGFGYTGAGYAGGYWDHGAFHYNRAVNNIPVNIHITNVYSRSVEHLRANRVSFNGGRGGVQARPSSAELAAGRQPHQRPVGAQDQQERLALGNPQLRASANHGRPPLVATPRPGAFGGHGAVHTDEAHVAPHRVEGTPSEGRAAHAPVRHEAPPREVRSHPTPHPQMRGGIERPSTRTEQRVPAQPAQRPAPHPAARPTDRPTGHADENDHANGRGNEHRPEGHR